jgi:hypothetical protein
VRYRLAARMRRRALLFSGQLVCKEPKVCCSSVLLDDRRMSRLLTPTLLRRCGSGWW